MLYVMLPIFAFYPSRETLPKAKEAALKALEIDDTLSEVHSSLAAVKSLHDWDWEGAEKEHRRAIELNPGNAGALLGYALFLMYLARHDAACEMIDRAVELDPLDPTLHGNRGMILYYARRYDEAMDELKTALEMAPNGVHRHIWLGIAYMQKSMHEEAMAEFERERVVSAGQNPFVEAFMGITYAEMGKQAEARRMLEQVLERAKQGYIPPMSPAGLYFALGEIDEGFEWLEKGYKERDYWICFLKIEPRLDSVRSDPRFKALLRKIGLDK
jgi:Tfp pilus assembly protein PilF